MSVVANPLSARSRRLSRAYLASFVSKGATAGMAFVALPLVVENLSVADFANYALVANAIIWSNLANPAFGPTTGVKISGLEARGDRQGAIAAARSTLTLSTCVGFVIVSIALVAVGRLGSLHRLELAGVGLVFALSCVGPVADSVRLGFLRHDRTSLWASGGVACAVAAVVSLHLVGSESMVHYALAVFGVAQATKVASFVDLSPGVKARSVIFGTHSRPVLREIAFGNASHMISQLVSFLGFPFAILLFAGSGQSRIAGVLFILQSLSLVISGLVQAVLPPLSAEVRGAIESGDMRWVKSVVVRLAGASLVLGLVGAGVSLLLAGPVFEALYGEVSPEPWHLALVLALIGPGSAAAVLYYTLVGAEFVREATWPHVPAGLIRIGGLLAALRFESLGLALLAILAFPELVRLPLYVKSMKGVLARGQVAAEPANLEEVS